ncbi:MAG TPA: D-glucuronyl C5-epimerase family protein, partial [Terriglobales bacterium]|nr:D-glucuronyl C5-epimerase family protein [Terriglobales bacterium]
MNLARRLNYYRRILPAYLGRGNSHLTFWHDSPEMNRRFAPRALGEYYMPFVEKADYAGPFDQQGVPLLDYRGKLGRQYNPIAIAQFGLGNFNLFCRTGQEQRRRRFVLAANWLVANLETNRAGLRVWNHDFDWEYRTTLRAPWQSALAQAQGISVLVRAFDETGDGMYLEAAALAFEALQKETSEGGMVHMDERGDPWLEEYIVSPPTHILNGFIWASWGVYDYWLATGEETARVFFAATIGTLRRNLEKYDAGFWSLYELAGTRLKMLASPFYHRLHISQLRVLQRVT